MAGTEQFLEPGIDPRTKKIAVRGVFGRNEGGTRTVSTVRHFDPVVTDEPDSLGGTNSAPSPLEMVLVSLIGCEGVIIHGVAKAMNFKYAGVDFECSGKIDVRGPKGVRGVRPYFEEVHVRIMLQTDESAERVEKLRVNVESRCPVTNLLRDAQVDLTLEWVALPSETRAGS